jgi:hypothetical protein
MFYSKHNSKSNRNKVSAWKLKTINNTKYEGLKRDGMLVEKGSDEEEKKITLLFSITLI